MIKALIIFSIMVTPVYADSVWQLSTNENPCSGMKIVGDNGNQEGYVLPAPEPYRDVIPENKVHIDKPLIQEVDFDDVNVDGNSAKKASPYNR